MVVKLTMCLKIICQRAVHKVGYVLENGNLKRKERSDNGLTLFNSEKKWQSTITPYSVFNKAKRIENMVRG